MNTGDAIAGFTPALLPVWQLPFGHQASACQPDSCPLSVLTPCLAATLFAVDGNARNLDGSLPALRLIRAFRADGLSAEAWSVGRAGEENPWRGLHQSNSQSSERRRGMAAKMLAFDAE